MIEKANELFNMYERIDYVRFYPERFVANAYKWPCPRTAYELYRSSSNRIVTHIYDAKRSHGKAD